MASYSAVLFDLGNTLVYRIVTQERTLRLLCDEAGISLQPGADYRGAVAIWRACHAAHYLAARSLEAENALARHETEMVLHHLAGEEVAKRYSDALGTGLQNTPRWWGVYDDVSHVLDMLRTEGIPMGIVSDWEASLPDFCQRMGLAHAFGAMVSTVAEGIVKPSPRLFEIALERVGVAAEQTLFVGDDYRMDVTGARAAGLTPVLIDRNDRFLETDCLKIRSMDELLDIVAGAAPPQHHPSVCITGFAL